MTLIRAGIALLDIGAQRFLIVVAERRGALTRVPYVATTHPRNCYDSVMLMVVVMAIVMV
jgi:hypothetical protein